MKKHLLPVVLLAAALACFAEGFDDMAYPNVDFMTYFQQEMKSLIQFQAENDINVPFFASFSGRVASLRYSSDYINYLYSGISDTRFDGTDNGSKSDGDFEVLGGFQFRPHRAVYIPLVFTFTSASTNSFINDVKPEGEEGEGWVPREGHGSSMSFFAGSGVVINTKNVKGGIYAGYGIHGPMTFNDRAVTGEDWENPEYYKAPTEPFSGFKIILVPSINTSSWKLVGNALNNILGYLDTGNLIALAAQDKGDSSASAIASTINAGLDFTFNRIHFGPLSLKANTVYSRGSFDAAAKNDVYGLRVQGQLSSFPFGFSLEGGYKRFFAVPKWLEKDYPNTGYFNGSFYCPLKRVTLGMIYRYDNIYKSKITFAVSANSFSGLFTLNPVAQYTDRDKFSGGMGYDFGARFRWGGWNAEK